MRTARIQRLDGGRPARRGYLHEVDPGHVDEVDVTRKARLLQPVIESPASVLVGLPAQPAVDECLERALRDLPLFAVHPNGPVAVSPPPRHASEDLEPRPAEDRTVGAAPFALATLRPACSAASGVRSPASAAVDSAHVPETRARAHHAK